MVETSTPGGSVPLWGALTDPGSPAVLDALTRRCEICHAKPDVLCHNTVQPSVALPGRRLVHIARAEG
jgi:hypothetical protein